MNIKYISGIELSKRHIAATLLATTFLFSSCDDGHPRLKESEIKTVYESSKGIETEIEEVPPGNEYKIIDERIIDEKLKSIAIVHNLDGTIDTLSMVKMKEDKDAYSRHYGVRGLMYRSLAYSFFDRNVDRVNPNRADYKTEAAYNKSTGLKSTLKSSATTRRIKVPTGASTGYGKAKSFRSFGG